MAKKFFYLMLCLFVISCGSDSSVNVIEKDSSNTNTGIAQMKFEIIPAANSGIDFTNSITESQDFNYYNYEYIYNGGGVACGDINNDGLVDLFFTGNQVSDKLYLNMGNMKFEDITSSAFSNQLNEGWHTGVTMADVNADGFLDLYICRSGLTDDKSLLSNLLFINNGDETFTEKSSEYGLNISAHSTHAAFFDFDNDGDLDVYILNHPLKYSQEVFSTSELIQLKKSGPDEDKLLRNNNGVFEDVTADAGIASNTYGLGLGISDINNDGFDDIYICSDFQDPDFLYVNNGNGTFTNELLSKTSHVSNFSMGVDIADFNNDEFPDIFTLDMASEDHIRSKRNMGGMSTKNFNDIVKVGFHYQYMFNSLQLNNGNGTFSEIGQLAGVSKTDWSWAPLFADFDNDGFKDLFVTNGYRRELRDNDYLNEHLKKKEGNIAFDPLEELKLVPTTKIHNYIYQNKGDLTFEKKIDQWGLNTPINSNGAAYADLDNDGDLDLILNNMEEKSFILENKLSGINNYVRFSLKGNTMNPLAIGAQVKIKVGETSQYQELQMSRGYISSVENILHFGLGKATKIDEVIVKFNDGKVIILNDLLPNQVYLVDHKEAKEMSVGSEKKNRLFRQITDSLFTHSDVEQPFNDFETEILLPNKMSQLGPFISKGDVNGDQLDDIYISGSLDERGALYIQTSTGFKLQPGPWYKNSVREELESIFLDVDNDNDLDLYIVSGGNEFTYNSEYLGHQLYINDGKGNFEDGKDRLPPIPISGQCIEAGDIDGDGDLDLFVGGRQLPGYYPFTPRSYLYINNKGTFVESTAKSPDLMSPGMVTDGVFDDFDDDGDLDLVIVGEWMPVSFYENTNGAFKNVTDRYNPAKDVGWFYSIEKADFNDDGKADYLVGNLGENNKFHPSFDNPLEIYCDDFDGNGTNDIVLAKYQNNICFPVRGRQCTSEQMPNIKEKFPSFQEFASADLNKIYGQSNLEKALHFAATNFDSQLFLSTGNSYSIESLPKFAQFGPVNKFICQDLNNDGKMDVIGVGNNFAAEVETIRYDGGRGFVLLGLGNGKFQQLSPDESGFFENGDCKDMEWIQFGKNQLVITVNNAAKANTFLYLK